MNLIFVQGRAKDGSDDLVRFVFREKIDDFNSRYGIIDFHEDSQTAEDFIFKWDELHKAAA